MPKGFGSAFDLSSLKAPKVEASALPGIAVNQATLVKELVPGSNSKVVIMVCWSPRSAQSLELIQTLAKFHNGDKDEKGEALWTLAHVNVDAEAQVDRKSTRLNSSHIPLSRMPSSA